MTNNQSNKNQRDIFPADTSERISKILEKYGLVGMSKELILKLAQAKTEEEKKKIREDIPGRQIAVTIKEVAGGKIPLEKLDSILAKRLQIPLEKAKKMAKDFKNEVLVPPPEETVEEEKTQKGISPGKSDVYREPIE